MLKLDEPLKHNWTIKYSVLTLQEEFLTLAEGNVFDFIPNVGDNVRIDNITYKVVLRTFDFDNSIIWLSLYDEKAHQKNPVK